MTYDEYFERKMKLIDKNGKGSGGTKHRAAKIRLGEINLWALSECNSTALP